ncbi:hypothetical protein BX600DRAFT_452219 [Xylariales sp. PMI_506]|nr:hypothetical protein BX600DRAFT_452219 [Xylariales sp. PMI_506]
MENPLMRLTQRAPRSCLQCARRKVKCDRRMPCSTCIKRGEASSCAREKVFLSAASQSAQSLEEIQDYETLRAENFRLRAALLAKSKSTNHDMSIMLPDTTAHNHVMELFAALETTSLPSSVKSTCDVIFPSRELSDCLMHYAAVELGWRHFALYFPKFILEYHDFLGQCKTPEDMVEFDPSWLAVYFSLLASAFYFKGSKVSSPITGMKSTNIDYLQLWFDAALFFLNKSDYVRNPNVHIAQAIVILRDVFHVVGQPTCFSILWPVAVRTAQALGIHQELELSKRDPLDAEICRRLWWGLVIGDWLSYSPSRCIRMADFNVDMPAVLDDDELAGIHFPDRTDEYPRAIHYHLFLVRGAIVIYDFQQMLDLATWTTSDVVSITERLDEKMAKLISDLPPWLRADTDIESFSATKFPWLSQMRTDLCYTLLTGRAEVNSTLGLGLRVRVG